MSTWTRNGCLDGTLDDFSWLAWKPSGSCGSLVTWGTLWTLGAVDAWDTGGTSGTRRANLREVGRYGNCLGTVMYTIKEIR